MNIFARVDGGRVVELIEPAFWEDGSEISIEDRFTPQFVESLVEVSGAEQAPQLGWSAEKSGGKWVFSMPVAETPTDTELKMYALAKRDALLAEADAQTLGQADAFVAGLLDEADSALFKAYAAYKLALGKIEKQPGYPSVIEWPSPPASHPA